MGGKVKGWMKLFANQKIEPLYPTFAIYIYGFECNE